MTITKRRAVNQGNIYLSVVGKLGYSILSEVYNSGKAFCYVTRREFPASQYLENFIVDKKTGIAISANHFEYDLWVKE